MEKAGPEREKIRDYRDLSVWKDSMDLAVDIYTLTRAFPRDEMFAMTSQMRRASTSIPANIAEGFGRAQRKVFIQFLRVAQGSLKELETHTVLSRRVGLLNEKQADDLGLRYEKLGKMLVSLVRSLERNGGER
ncbi:four helix bundle protein [Phyllobacterium phragmitis]|uniref:Four helix bundle protein n=1 Tax=Phyllobacterium phragmitis TaxID=2670329 RepID=A0A2S9IN84_9HYPH|nr:four helix bundle protein [Phyllobacterium phragmitis]PRD41942.1 four helix bundle protein [Phyllobacterium phragmitis]